jgi:hypothetical protein
MGSQTWKYTAFCIFGIVFFLLIMPISILFFPINLFCIGYYTFDLALYRRRRHKAWAAFLKDDLALLRQYKDCCKVYRLTDVRKIHFNPKNSRLSFKFRRRRAILPIAIEQRSAAKQFVERLNTLRTCVT